MFSGNNILSCYPNSNTTVYQNEWATFVCAYPGIHPFTAPDFTSTLGNSRLPQYAAGGTVNVYLFHGDSNEQVLSRLNYPNPGDRAGSLTALINDTWWGDRGQDWNGQNISYLYYWVITPGTQTALGSNYLPQATFAAVRESFSPYDHLASAHPYFRHSGSSPESNGNTPLQRPPTPIRFSHPCPQLRLPHQPAPVYPPHHQQDPLPAYKTVAVVPPFPIGPSASSPPWVFWLFWLHVSFSSFSAGGDEGILFIAIPSRPQHQ